MGFCRADTLGSFIESKVSLPGIKYKPVDRVGRADDKAKAKSKSKKSAGLWANGMKFDAPIPSPQDIKPLARPIVIAQSCDGLTGPFTRAYSDSLLQYNITQEMFLEFIDTLNIVISPSPAFELVAILGEVMDVIPVAPCQIIGPCLIVASLAAKYATVRLRLTKFIRALDCHLFHPRGLSLRVLSSKQLCDQLDIARDSLVAPLSRLQVSMSVSERRMSSLIERGLVAADLRFSDLPPPLLQRSNVMRRFASYSVRVKQHQQERGLLKSRDREMQRQDWYDPSDATMADIPQFLTGDPQKDKKTADKRQQTLLHRASTGKEAPKWYSSNRAADNERKVVKRVMWLVIEPLE